MDMLVDLAPPLTALVVLAFFIERAVAPVLEWKGFQDSPNLSYWKVPFAFAVSLIVAMMLDFDLLREFAASEIIDTPEILNRKGMYVVFGYVFTALILTGGSAAALKLMQDVLGISKKTRDLVRAAKNEEVAARLERARGEIEQGRAVQKRAMADIQIAKNMARASDLDVEARLVAAARGMVPPSSTGVEAQDVRETAKQMRISAMGPELKAKIARSLDKARIMKLEHAAGRPAS